LSTVYYATAVVRAKRTKKKKKREKQRSLYRRWSCRIFRLLIDLPPVASSSSSSSRFYSYLCTSTCRACGAPPFAERAGASVRSPCHRVASPGRISYLVVVYTMDLGAYVSRDIARTRIGPGKPNHLHARRRRRARRGGRSSSSSPPSWHAGAEVVVGRL
jgi:hypothetical protein